jgi:hypothetical protein
MTDPATTGRRRALPPGLIFDLPVLVLLGACWLTVGLALAHLLTGLALVALIVVHLLTRRARVGRLWSWRRSHPPRSTRRSSRRLLRQAGYLLLLALAAGMTVSGLLRWAGVPREQAWHATSSYALMSAAFLHAWMVRRRLRARVRTRAPRPGSRQASL